jgi:hypothetical protein
MAATLVWTATGGQAETALCRLLVGSNERMGQMRHRSLLHSRIRGCSLAQTFAEMSLYCWCSEGGQTMISTQDAREERLRDHGEIALLIPEVSRRGHANIAPVRHEDDSNELADADFHHEAMAVSAFRDSKV